MEKSNQGRWDKRMMAVCRWTIKRDLNNIEHNNQKREIFYHSSYVHLGFIFAVCLLKDLMKILVGLGIFSPVIFKDLGSDCYSRNSFFTISNICWFKYKSGIFYDFTLWNIVIGQYHIYRKQMKKCFFSKMSFPVGWGCRIHRLLLCRGIRPPPNECPGYDTKQSDGEVPAMLELWGMRSTPSLSSLPRPLWPRVGSTW